MTEVIETQILKWGLPVLFQGGMKMFDWHKTRDELADANRNLATAREELAGANRKLAEKDEQLVKSQAMFEAYQDKQELILWSGSFLIIILLAIMLTSVRRG
jgi:hypothetical protein